MAGKTLYEWRIIGEGGDIKRLHNLHYPYSLGTFYENVTASLGFKPHAKHASSASPDGKIFAHRRRFPVIMSTVVMRNMRWYPKILPHFLHLELAQGLSLV